MKSHCSRKLSGLIAGVMMVSGLVSMPVYAQFNQEIMMKWADATVVHYSVVGDYDDEVMVVRAGTNGYAVVKDHVEFGFDYDVTNAALVGTPSVTNATSQVGALRNGANGCRPPTLSGPYEHATIESIEPGMGGALTLMVRTDYPAAQMTVACTGGNQPVDAHTETDPVDFPVPGIMLLAMGAALTGDDVRVSPDGTTFTIKHNDWTYVVIPTKVR